MNGLDYLMLRLCLNKWHIWQLSASLYFKKDELDTIPAFLIGGVIYMLIESIAGVVLFYGR
jgi:hypothetical protein